LTGFHRFFPPAGFPNFFGLTVGRLTCLGTGATGLPPPSPPQEANRQQHAAAAAASPQRDEGRLTALTLSAL
jgi:hypothetical protein